MRNQLKSGFVLSAALLLAHATNSAAQSYSYSDLGSGAANAINDAGQVVGVSGASAMIWDGSSETVLGSLGHYDDATAINNVGQVVGFDDVGNPNYQALAWSGNTPATLGTAEGLSGIATGINSSGVTVGVAYQPGHRHQLDAVIWNGSQATTLGIISSQATGTTYSRATGINDDNQEVGYFYQDNHSGMRQAVLWNGTSATLLGTLGSGTSSEATAINDNGEEVGYSDAPGFLHRSAVIWNGTTATALASLGGTNSMALGINNGGEVVGYSYLTGNTTKQAVLWNDGKIINLNSTLTSAEINAGWVLEEATGINSNGTIVGIADNTITGKSDAFELNVIAAVPEPKSVVMYLMGLGLLGFMAQRRNKNSLRQRVKK